MGDVPLGPRTLTSTLRLSAFGRRCTLPRRRCSPSGSHRIHGIGAQITGTATHALRLTPRPFGAQIPVCSARTGSGSNTWGIKAFGGIVPSRPASKSSRAWPISALVFMTKGP